MHNFSEKLPAGKKESRAVDGVAFHRSEHLIGAVERKCSRLGTQADPRGDFANFARSGGRHT
jgi:hypothetical protein